MALLGLRFAHVAQPAEAKAITEALRGLGLQPKHFPEAEGFAGEIFPTDDVKSLVEIWHAGPEMPEGTMLQLVVVDADAMAEEARRNGLDPQGPVEAHGEKIYFLTLPGGLPLSFQSRL